MAATLIRTLVFVGTALVATSCNPYDPDLGLTPFRCGTTEPRCPEDFTCVNSQGKQLCVKNGSSPVDAGDTTAADSVPFTCSDDSDVEPNDSISTALVLPIPPQPTEQLVRLAICPATDVDFYRFRIDTTGKNAVVQIEYNASHGILALDMLETSGVVIKIGAPVAGNPNIVNVAVNNMASGTYFARVTAAAGVENNYDRITFTTSE